MENKQISALYPFLAINHPQGYHNPGDTWVTDLPEGWQSRFLQWAAEVKDILKRYQIPESRLKVGQVKEKFGSARVYWNWDIEYQEVIPEAATEAITLITDNFEERARVTCHLCGEVATLRSIGWVAPHCRECAERVNAECSERHKTNFSINKAFKTL